LATGPLRYGIARLQFFVRCLTHAAWVFSQARQI
jgi:hypothetical protein